MQAFDSEKREEKILKKKEERSRLANVIVSSVGILIFLTVCALVCIYLWPHIEAIIKDPALVRSLANRKGIVAIPVFILLQILQVVVAIIPGEALEIGAGAAFGWFGGFLLAQLGVMLGTVLIFAVSRRLGKSFVESITDGRKLVRFEKLDKSRHRDRIIFLVFLIPGLPKDILTYAAAFFDIRLVRFLTITLTARIPSIISSTLAADFLISKNYLTAIIIFVVTALISLLCFLLSEKILSNLENTK